MAAWRRGGRSGANAYLAGYEDCATELEAAIAKENAVSRAVKHLVKLPKRKKGDVLTVHLPKPWISTEAAEAFRKENSK